MFDVTAEPARMALELERIALEDSARLAQLYPNVDFYSG